MTKKQIIGIVVAAVAFIAVGVSSVMSKALVGSLSSAVIDSGVQSSTAPSEAYIGVLAIESSIASTYNSAGEAISGSPLALIESFAADADCRGIMLYLNSPGGSVYGTDEVYRALLDYKQQTGNPVYAWGASTVASGAYYISCAADEFTADRNCWVGSIGVYVQHTDVSALIDSLGIDVTYITTGENKAMGNIYTPLTEEQLAIYQALIDSAYEQFLGIVMDARGYSRDELLPIADGRVYTADQGLENGLIDGIETYDEACARAMSECGAASMYAPRESVSWLDSLTSQLAALLPRSDTQSALDFIENADDQTVMYYAEF